MPSRARYMRRQHYFYDAAIISADSGGDRLAARPAAARRRARRHEVWRSAFSEGISAITTASAHFFLVIAQERLLRRSIGYRHVSSALHERRHRLLDADAYRLDAPPRQASNISKVTARRRARAKHYHQRK